MHAYTDATVAFRDSNGLNWLRDASGQLTRIDQEPQALLEIEQPYGQWGSIRPSTWELGRDTPL